MFREASSDEVNTYTGKSFFLKKQNKKQKQKQKHVMSIDDRI